MFWAMFWAICATLILLALLSLLPALLGKRRLRLESPRERNIAIARERKTEILSLRDAGELNEAETRAALQDLEASLAADLTISTDHHERLSARGSKAGLITTLLAIPLVSLGMYQLTGTPDAPELLAQADNARAQLPKSLTELVEGLEQKVADNPNDLRGKILLAETYKRLQRYEDATRVYETVAPLADTDAPEYANVLASHADAIIMASEETFTGKAIALLDQALQLDPQHVDSLWLRGMAAAEHGETERALQLWQRLRPLLADQPDYVTELDRMIADVNNAAPPAPDKDPGEQSTLAEARPPTTLTVEVNVSDALRTRVSPSDSVFIFARAESGPPMPLAVSRQTVAALPLTVELDDSMAMMPQLALSRFQRVVVGARISKSGQAVAQPGDFQSALVATDLPTEAPLTLTISEQVE